MTEREHPQNSEQVEDVTEPTAGPTTEQGTAEDTQAIDADSGTTEVIDAEPDTRVIETAAGDTELIETVDAPEPAEAAPVAADTTVIETAEAGDTQVIESPTRTAAFAAAPTTEFPATGAPAEPEEERLSAPDDTAAPAPDESTPVEPLPTAAPSAGPRPETTRPDATPAGPPPGATPAGPPPAAPQQQAPYTVPAPPVAPVPTASGPRAGTVIWGLIVVAVGAAVLAGAVGLHIDFQLAFIGLLAVAGVGLLISSLVNAARRRDRSAS